MVNLLDIVLILIVSWVYKLRINHRSNRDENPIGYISANSP
jgi:hypothetical protein